MQGDPGVLQRLDNSGSGSPTGKFKYKSENIEN